MHDGVRAEDLEIIFVGPRQMAGGTHEHARFILGWLDGLGAGCLDENLHGVSLTMPLFVKGGDGHQQVVIAGLPEGAAQRLSHTYDFVRMRAGAYGFADRVNVGEQLLYDIRPDETYRGMMGVVRVGQHASHSELDVSDVQVVR